MISLDQCRFLGGHFLRILCSRTVTEPHLLAGSHTRTNVNKIVIMLDVLYRMEGGPATWSLSCVANQPLSA